MKVVQARIHARKARVPFVVVMAMGRPPTFSRVNSRGELPISKAMLPVRWFRMRTPSRSPASSMAGSSRRKSRASEISATGKIALAPFSRAVTTELVARRTSKTTHTVSLKSRPSKVAKSAGVKRTSREVEGMIREIRNPKSAIRDPE